MGLVASGLVLTVVAAALLPLRCLPEFGDPCGTSDDDVIRSSSDGDLGALGSALDDGGDPNARDGNATPMQCAVAGHHATSVALLLDRGAHAGPASLAGAVRAGDVEIVRELLDHGVAPHADLLVVAAGGGSPDLTWDFVGDTKQALPDEATAITALLLERGADPNAVIDEPTPLLFAAFNGRDQVVALLLAAGADPNRGGVVTADLIRFAQLPVGDTGVVPQPSGPTVANVPPLVGAVWQGQLDEARLLLDAGADPNLASDDAFTPIYAAAVLGNEELVRLLLDRGANPIPVVRAGVMRPADAARAANHPETAVLLESST